jgi:lipid-binding SYLF domain-containing protein
MIFPPGSSSALPESPAMLEKSPKEQLLPRQGRLSMSGSMYRIDRSRDRSIVMLTEAVKVDFLAGGRMHAGVSTSRTKKARR